MKRLLLCAATALLLLAFMPLGRSVAAGDPAPAITVVDGETAPVFSYPDAIRERVSIPVPGVDQDDDGVVDRTVVEIIRPRESDAGLKVPAIIDPSPYYTTIGRGHESEKIADVDGDGLNDHWPLYVDNYFVPRGYAVLLAEMDGTGNSTGCPMHGGPGDIASMKAVVDWLHGRTPGFAADGTPMVADWDNGKAAMIGKSYDGTLANGVAATGVDGLTTIVSESAISSWYDYSRMGGIRFNTHYPASLSKTITNQDRWAACAASRDVQTLADGDASGDLNQFWQDRDYVTDVDKVHASVLAVQGINDDNVRPNQLDAWWAGLAANDVPRKLWLSQEGHVDPFDFRREEWVHTLHGWFDHWLQGLDNGIMTEPRVSIETAADVWENHPDWPLPGTKATAVHLGGTAPGAAGRLLLESDGGTDTLAFVDSATQTETTAMTTPEGSQANRLAFLSDPLTKPLHISGTPKVQLQASLDKTQSNLGAIVVDYGSGTHVTRSNDGVASTTTSSCWGEASANDDACYLEVRKPTVQVDQWRVSKGILDSSNRDSLTTGTPVTPGQSTAFHWPVLPTDYVFPAGHRIGVVLVGDYRSYPSVPGTTGATITVDTRTSTVLLPVVGGKAAAEASGAFGPLQPRSLSFDVGDHGAPVPAESVPYGTAPTAPPSPTETGWVFDGWFTDATLTTPFSFTAPLTADATAYAKWSPEVHRVAFDLAGHGDPIDTQDVVYGEAATVPAPPTDGGWTFRGWYADPELTTVFDFATPVTDDRTAHAGWSAVTAVTVGPAAGTVPAEHRDVPLTATVGTTDPASAPPAGTVQFLSDGAPLGSPVPVDTHGVATADLPAPPAGTHRLEAEFVPADARWGPATDSANVEVLTIESAVDALELTSSAVQAGIGETITVVTVGRDRYGASLGDVSASVSLTSSVASDQVDGDRVTFRHASPHVLTGRLGTASGRVTVTVHPAGAGPGPTPGPTSGTDPGATPAAGGQGAPPAAGTAIPATGNAVAWWLPILGGMLCLAGLALVVPVRRVGRRRAD